MRTLENRTKKWMNGAALTVCLGMILYITVFSRTPALIRSARMLPFSAWKDALSGNTQTGLQIAANIVLFVPFGYFIRRLPWAGLASILLSAGIELIQYHWILGIASVDDVLANLLGGLLGAGLYAAICRLPRFRVLSAGLSILMLSGGLFGCRYWKPRIREIYESEFTFQVEKATKESLTGYCFRFHRSPVKQRVQLLLKGEQTIPLTTEYGLERPDVAARYADGQDYTHVGFQASLPDALTGSYEISLVWNGRRETPTGVWLVDGKVRHCLSEWDDRTGTLLADNEYCSIFQRGQSLYWTVKDMASERIFVHIYTNQLEHLPQERQKSGFGNMDFHFESYEIEPIDGRRTACRELPEEYAAAYIQTGMFNRNGVIWSERFRPLTTAFEQEAE